MDSHIGYFYTLIKNKIFNIFLALNFSTPAPQKQMTYCVRMYAKFNLIFNVPLYQTLILIREIIN